jgi:nucleotide-binding universal stress UspA family protein
MAHIYSEAPTVRPQKGTPTIRRIILPLDGMRLAERAIEPAIMLARAFAAEVALVRCYEPVSHLPSGNTGLSLLRPKPTMPLHVASLYLARIEETFRQRGVRAQGHLFQWPAASAIVETARRGSDDLIVMATRAGSVDMQRMGSVAADIMDAGMAPVLLVTNDTHSIFDSSGSHERLRVLAIDTDAAVEVEAYAQLLAGALRGTVAHAFTHLPSPRRKAPIAKDTSGTGKLTEDAPCTVDRLATIARTRADVVVLKGSLPLADSGPGRENAAALLQAAGLPVLVVP